MMVVVVVVEVESRTWCGGGAGLVVQSAEFRGWLVLAIAQGAESRGGASSGCSML